MSVIVKDMNMPKSCSECIFEHTEKYDYLFVRHCAATKDRNYIVYWRKKKGGD